jgi:hypothetical protein
MDSRSNIFYESISKHYASGNHPIYDKYGIEKSLYESKIKLPVHFYKYNYVVPVANSDSLLPERTTMYGKIVFRLKEEIYTVYLPLE